MPYDEDGAPVPYPPERQIQIQWDDEIRDQAIAEAQALLAKSRSKGNVKFPKDRRVKSRAVHIWNVGPFSFRRYCGSWGEFIIPACPSGHAAHLALTVPGVLFEPQQDEREEIRFDQINGISVAREILGGDLVRQGVFIGAKKGYKPNAGRDEVYSARLEARSTCIDIVTQVFNSWKAPRDHRPWHENDRHAQAFSFLGIKPPWEA